MTSTDRHAWGHVNRLHFQRPLPAGLGYENTKCDFLFPRIIIGLPSSKIRSIQPRSVFLLTLALLLNACQSLPRLNQDTAYESVPLHRFSLHKNESMVGGLAEVEVDDNDSLALIGRHFGLGFDEITLANPDLDPWIPEAGRRALLPLQFILPDAPRRGIVLNLAAKRLFYYPKSAFDTVYTYPVGVGRDGWETPLGLTRIVAKKAHPNWTVPASVRREHAKKGDPLPRVVAAGPDNPLGEYAMRLGIAGYLIHGTNKPYGVGMEVSHGCVRLFPEDISRLFKQTPVGTPVNLVNQPYLIAWQDDMLFLQAYPPNHKNARQTKRQIRSLMARLRRIDRDSDQAIDWDKVEAVLTRADGVPAPILKGSIPAAALTRVAHPSTNYGDTVPDPLTIDAWRLWVGSFDEQDQARRFAAMLNHQGPTIPAHAFGLGDAYAVVAGPFKEEREAQSAAKRILLDFSVEAQLISPGKAYAGKTETDGLLTRVRGLFE
ncbi:MAG: L,D-transpeptidase family protein [Gammaproteobacteria bacterium]